MTSSEVDSMLSALDRAAISRHHAGDSIGKQLTQHSTFRSSLRSAAKAKWILLVCLWLSGIGAGMLFLARFENTTGQISPTPSHWPAKSHLDLEFGRPNLVMVVHPQCPCTRASLNELAEILARSQGQIAARVLFCRPVGAPKGWEQGSLWNQARAIPALRVEVDVDGVEANLFGAATSGHVFLYSPNGQLLFSGGITRARGQSGESAARHQIQLLVSQELSQVQKGSVFGCPLTGGSEISNKR